MGNDETKRKTKTQSITYYILNIYIIFLNTLHSSLISSCRTLVVPNSWPWVSWYSLCTLVWADPENHLSKPIFRKPTLFYKLKMRCGWRTISLKLLPWLIVTFVIPSYTLKTLIQQVFVTTHCFSIGSVVASDFLKNISPI